MSRCEVRSLPKRGRIGQYLEAGFRHDWGMYCLLHVCGSTASCEAWLGQYCLLWDSIATCEACLLGGSCHISVRDTRCAVRHDSTTSRPFFPSCHSHCNCLSLWFSLDFSPSQSLSSTTDVKKTDSCEWRQNSIPYSDHCLVRDTIRQNQRWRFCGTIRTERFPGTTATPQTRFDTDRCLLVEL
jgi:hypothetical protein